MDLIYKHHQTFLSNTKSTFIRNVLKNVDWSDRLIGIKGARGVGKTTFIAQHILKNFQYSNKALYISMDNLSLKSKSLFEIAEKHLAMGGTHLFVDEVHKYPSWSFAIKNIYDLLPNLNVVFTGSSLLAITGSNADLSRRALIYTMHGLSLREFINIEYHSNFAVLDINQILENHMEIAQEITSQTKVLKYFIEYLEYGYYPFFKEGKTKYSRRLEQVINTVLDVDLSYTCDTSMHNIFKLKKFLNMLAESGPYEPNISKLAGSIEMQRNTLNQLIYSLVDAEILNVLLDSGKSYSHLSKPEKIYMNNTNLLYAFSAKTPDTGVLREVFFMNQLNNNNTVSYSKNGDFLIDEKYIFEIGGKNKKYKQIAGIPNSFIASDDLITGVKNKIPIWLFGFLY